MPRIMPEPRYFSMPSIEVGAEVLRKRALNCWPWARSLTHPPDAVIHSPAEIDAACPTTRHEIAISARLGSENAEAVLLVVEGDPLDQARQHFLRRRLQFQFHPRNAVSRADCATDSLRDSRRPIDVAWKASDRQRRPLRARDLFPGEPEMALSRELNLALRNSEVPVRAQAAVVARHVWNASSRRMWSVRREVRWRGTLKVLKMAA
jgi:hypothetical protein